MLLLTMSLCVAAPVSAAGKTGKLSLWCVKDDEILTGMHWRIYRVGHREQKNYVFEGEFAAYRPTLGDQTKPMLEWDAETIASAAETLSWYAELDKIPFRADGNTDADGKLVFSGLEDGLYLVTGDSLNVGEKIYIPSAIFFEVNSNQENNLDAFPKIIRASLNHEETRYAVKKVWANNENQPPALDTYILCEIYCDGKLNETVRLDRTNNWQYRWVGESGHRWLVKEKEIPENYTVSYQDNERQYIIVNTYEEPTPTTTETTTTLPQTTTTVQTVVTVPKEPKLPQTGQLWWPVFPLAGGGLVLIGIGIGLRKKDEGE